MAIRATLLVLAACAAAAGCKTTSDVVRQQGNRWIGKPADDFFRAHGAPQSVFALQDGGRLYTWRGGETHVVEPAKVQPAPNAAAPAAAAQSSTRSTTTTTVSQPAPGTTVTQTTTRSSTVGTSVALPAAAPVVVTPARRIEILCEAQIAVDTAGKITGFKITRDTRATGFALTRCAEVFDS